MEFTDVQIVTFLYLIPTIFAMLFRLFGLGHGGKGRVELGFGIFIVYLLIVPSLLIESFGYAEYARFAALVMLSGSGVVLIFSSEGLPKSFFLYLLQANMAMVIASSCHILWHMLKMSYPILLLILLTISIILLLVAIRLWAKPLRYLVEAAQTGWPILIAIEAIILALAMLVPGYIVQSFEQYSVFYTGIILGIEFCSFLYIYVLYRNLRKTNEMLEATCRQKLLKNSIAVMRAEDAMREEFLFNLRDSMYDLRYHNAQIMEYIENGDTESAISYLRTYDSCITEPVRLQYCQNSIVNTVMHRYVHMAQAEGITCRVDTVIPRELPFTDQEICIMLGNLLENALEACMIAENVTDKILTVSAKMEDIHLMLEIRNTAMESVQFDGQGVPLTNYPGGGLGTRTVVEIIEKHGDLIRFRQREGIFIVQLMIHL